MDRYNALLVFRHVAQLGSFAAAARKLRLSAPAISKNVADLESHLGVRLINRTTRSMALTEEGKTYLEHVMRGLDALTEGEAALGNAKAEPTGTLRVSAPMTVTLTRFSQAIPAFLSRYPELRLDLDLDDRRVDIIREGFDVAVRSYGDLEDSGLIAKKLGVMPYALCASPSYFATHGRPLEPIDLKALTHVRFPFGGNADFWEFRKAGRVERIPVAARYSVTSSLAVRDALRAGLGVSLIPIPYVENDLKSGELELALGDWSAAETTHYAVYPSRQHLAPKVRVFIDFLVDQFGRSRLAR